MPIGWILRSGAAETEMPAQAKSSELKAGVCVLAMAKECDAGARLWWSLACSACGDWRETKLAHGMMGLDRAVRGGGPAERRVTSDAASSEWRGRYHLQGHLQLSISTAPNNNRFVSLRFC